MDVCGRLRHLEPVSEEALEWRDLDAIAVMATAHQLHHIFGLAEVAGTPRQDSGAFR